jgi:hypothetical protein
MSQQELLDAYLDGQISRRTLIRRLAATGIGLGAAVSYAHLLAPKARAVPDPADAHYPIVDLKIKTLDLADVIEHKRLRVRVRADEEVTVNLFAETRKNGQSVLLGSQFCRLDAAGRRRVKIPLDNVKPLRNRQKVKVFVTAFGSDDEHYPLMARDVGYARTSAFLRR